MDVYLIKMNKHLDDLNKIFPNMIKNCYIEFYVFENYTKETVEYIYNRTLDSIYSEDNSISVTDCSNLILEFISGNFVSINATTDGTDICSYKNNYRIIESIDEIIL